MLDLAVCKIIGVYLFDLVAGHVGHANAKIHHQVAQRIAVD